MKNIQTAVLFPIDDYRALSKEVLSLRIRAVKRNLGQRVLSLAHHDQSDETMAHSDRRGDSLQLCHLASQCDCEAIVFCGHHGMAETLDVLVNSSDRLAIRTGRRISVIVPNLEARNSNTDLVSIEQLERAWIDLGQIVPIHVVAPVASINSAASVKAFCGRHGGTVCTSSNAGQIVKWAFDKSHRVLFLPDEHLGRDTALALGLSETQMQLWDPSQNQLLGNTASELENCRLILWKDNSEAPHGLAAEHPVINCIKLADLCWSLENLAAHAPVNIIRVDDETQRWSLVALQRMLDLG